MSTVLQQFRSKLEQVFGDGLQSAASLHNRLNSVLTYIHNTERNEQYTCAYKHSCRHTCIHTCTCTLTIMYTCTCTYTHTHHSMYTHSYPEELDTGYCSDDHFVTPTPDTHIDNEGGRKEGKETDTYPLFEAQERIFFF